jgi:prephenate dehydrogenase
MKIGIIGTGNIGRTFARKLSREFESFRSFPRSCQHRHGCEMPLRAPKPMPDANV